MAPEATSDGNGSSTMEAAQKKKHRKRKKSRSSCSAAESVTSSLPGNGDDQDPGQLAGDGQEQEQQQRGKQRVVWTEELHDKFVKAYDILGKDAVPKKILAMMNVDGITRENVASHLQKHRLNLKREEQRKLDKMVNNHPFMQKLRHKRRLCALCRRPLHPPADHQAPEASSSLHSLPPPQSTFRAVNNMSQLQIAQQLLQTTPPADCFGSNSAATNFILHTPQVFHMVQPIQQRFMPPMEPTGVMWQKLVKEQDAGLEDATTKQAAAAASVGYNPMLPRNNVVAHPLHIQASSQVVNMNREILAPEANLKFEEEEIRRAQVLMAAKAEEMLMATKAEQGQEGRGAERDAAEMAAKAEEGQSRAAEAAATAAGSLNPPGSSIVGQFWKSHDTVVSWDFVGFPCYKTTD